MQTRNMEKSENNHQFKIIFNYNIFDKYFSKIFPWYKAVYGAIVGVGVGIFDRNFLRDMVIKGQAICYAWEVEFFCSFSGMQKKRKSAK